MYSGKTSSKLEYCIVQVSMFIIMVSNLQIDYCIAVASLGRVAHGAVARGVTPRPTTIYMIY